VPVMEVVPLFGQLTWHADPTQVCACAVVNPANSRESAIRTAGKHRIAGSPVYL
jgi:hypothetical protein